MELFVISGGGNIPPSNPVIFENDTYLDGVTEQQILYGSDLWDNNTHTYNDGIRFSAKAGKNSDAVYLSFDLSNYVGKKLWFAYTINGGSVSAYKSFDITSTSKKIVMGVACIQNSGWQEYLGFGISNVNYPSYVNANSDIYQTYYANGSTSEPYLRIRKIWIDNE